MDEVRFAVYLVIDTWSQPQLQTTRHRDRARKGKLRDTRAIKVTNRPTASQRQHRPSESQFLEGLSSDSESNDALFSSESAPLHRTKRRCITPSPKSLDCSLSLPAPGDGGSAYQEDALLDSRVPASTPSIPLPFRLDSPNEIAHLLESPVRAPQAPTPELLSTVMHESVPLQVRLHTRNSPEDLDELGSSSSEPHDSGDEPFNDDKLSLDERLAGLSVDDDGDDERPWYLAPSDDERGQEPPSEESSQRGMEDGNGSQFDEEQPDGQDNSRRSPENDPPPSPPSQPLIIKPQKNPVTVYLASHHLWFVRVTLVVVVLLHFSYHLPFAACDLALFLFYLILKGLKLASKRDSVPITLTTAIRRLNLQDRFKILPVCPAPACHHVFLDDLQDIINNDYRCTQCDEQVFDAASDTLVEEVLELFLRRKVKTTKPPVPKLVVAYRPISELVAEFLEREGMVDKMDEWRYKPRSEDVLGDIMDGRIWKELQGNDSKPFFGDHCPDELRIGITVNLDW